MLVFLSSIRPISPNRCLCFPFKTYPCESETADGIGQHVPQQRGVAVEGGEVGVHVGTLPMGDLQQKSVSKIDEKTFQCTPHTVSVNAHTLLYGNHDKSAHSSVNSSVITELRILFHCFTLVFSDFLQYSFIKLSGLNVT